MHFCPFEIGSLCNHKSVHFSSENFMKHEQEIGYNNLNLDATDHVFKFQI